MAGWSVATASQVVEGKFCVLCLLPFMKDSLEWWPSIFPRFLPSPASSSLPSLSCPFLSFWSFSIFQFTYLLPELISRFCSQCNSNTGGPFLRKGWCEIIPRLMKIHPYHKSISTDLGRADETENAELAFSACQCLFYLPSWGVIPSSRCSLPQEKDLVQEASRKWLWLCFFHGKDRDGWCGKITNTLLLIVRSYCPSQCDKRGVILAWAVQIWMIL